MARSFLDTLAVVAPGFARRMMVERHYYAETRMQIERRKYDMAQHSRLTKNWQAGSSSADQELVWDLPIMRNRSSDLVRNNPYATSALRQLVDNMVGTGIRARAQHKTATVRRKAQAAWDRFCKEQQFYRKQALAVRSAIERGDSALLWSAKNGVPDSKVSVLEGDYIDHTQTARLDNGARRVMGVEFDSDGDVVGYALHENHPGDVLNPFISEGVAISLGNGVRRVPAEYVDHFFEELRAGQTRGVPWMSAGGVKLREMADLAEAIRTKKRIQACLTVMRSPGPDDDASPVGDRKADAGGRTEETIRPGMIMTGRPGETLSSVNPSQDGDSDTFYRNEIMSFCASVALPYHLVTGDLTGSNYTSMRAGNMAFGLALDAWQELHINPRINDPAFVRVMRREALLTGDYRLLEVTAIWTAPARPLVDPLKDQKAVTAAIRAGNDSFAEACARGGKDWREVLAETAEFNAEVDKLGIVLDCDPRRVNTAGLFQPDPATNAAQQSADA